MLLLADRPEAMASLVPPTTIWSGGAVRDLLPVDRSLWQALAAGEPVWSARLEQPEVSWWPRLVLIDHARSSQFDALRDLRRQQHALSGPVAALALRGDGFHGHHGRSWSAQPGNLHLSVAIPARLDAAAHVAALTMLPAVATVDAIRRGTDGAVRPEIKWMNDVLVAGRKTAGVITATQSQQLTIEAVFLGIGLNVCQTPDLSPTLFVPAAGCLATAMTRAPSLGTLLLELLRSLAERFCELEERGPAPLFEAYRQHSGVLGQQVRIYGDRPGEELEAPLCSGRVTAIEPDLSLRLEGHPEPVRQGRLAFETVCQQLGR